MKKTIFKCDRCRAELGEESTALCQQQFSVEHRISYRFRFFRKWKTHEPELIVWELCERCRESLDRWIESGGGYLIMDNTINGRTPQEIKRGLECTNRLKFPNAYCSGCSYYVRVAEHLHECKSVEIITDALALIQQLECERDEAWNDLDTINYANTELHSAYDAMKRERDAAVQDMTELMHLAKFCRHCKHLTDDGKCTHDFDDTNGLPWNCWQWRGVEVE